MNRAARTAVALIVLALAPSGRAHAADAKAARAEIEAHEKAFLAAYENGETKKMKTEIGKAVSLGEKSGLSADPLMADVYVLAAVLDVDGNDNAKAGVRDFVKALKIKPDVAIPKGMGTSPVKAALKQARIEAGLAPKEGAAAVAAAPAAKPAEAAKEPAAAPQEKSEKSEKADDKVAQQEAEKKEKQKAADDVAAAEKTRAVTAAKQQQETKEQQDKLAREERERQDGLEKQRKELAAQAKESQGKKDKELADAKARVQQLEKDKADLERKRADDAKVLADAKSRIQQLEKDKADLERKRAESERQRADDGKQLAAARAQETRAREELDKVARDKQAAEAQARDAENKKQQERQARERLFAGPEMPARLREALTCNVPDEAPLRADLFVHCVARPNVKAKSILFFYRAGSAHYYSVPMERTARGWYAAVVPGARVMGKAMQYYAQALDGRETVVASNGKEASPNILPLRAGGPRS